MRREQKRTKSEEDPTRHLRRAAKARSVVSRSPMPPREEKRRPRARRCVAACVGDPSQPFHPRGVTCGKVLARTRNLQHRSNFSRDAGWPRHRAMPGCERWRLRPIVKSTVCRTRPTMFVQDPAGQRAIDGRAAAARGAGCASVAASSIQALPRRAGQPRNGGMIYPVTKRHLHDISRQKPTG